eukprot:scaffold55_cov401-Prasinococcus_capsulatus_cf.AAC.12
MMLALGRYRINNNFDSWSGYAGDRTRFLRLIHKAENAIVYAGDSHQAWASELRLDGTVVASEYDTTSVTSPGPERGLPPYFPKELISQGLLESNPSAHYADAHHGYLLVRLDEKYHHAEFIQVDYTRPQNSRDAKCVKAFRTLVRSQWACWHWPVHYHSEYQSRVWLCLTVSYLSLGGFSGTA